MIVFKFPLIHLCLFSFFICFSHSDDKTNECTYATTNKPVGYYDYATGYAKVHPYRYFQYDSKDICNNNCRVTDECWATSFNGNKNCSFYNTSSFYIQVDVNGVQYSQWKICNMSDGQSPPDGRCRGLWVRYLWQKLSVISYVILGTLYTDVNVCRKTCLDNSLCGFVNYMDRNSICQLVPKWPYRNLNTTFTNQSNTYNWTCVDNYVEQIEAPTNIFKPLDEKCTGHWTISSRNREVKGGNIIGLFFQTQIYKECLDECNQYANCRTALYNITYSICVLINVSHANIILPEAITRFIAFEWKCVKNDSHKPYMNEDEKRYKSLGMKCYQIENNTHLLIGKDECGKHPKLSSFLSCDQITSNDGSIKWNIKESCLINQTYWTFPAKVVQMNISGYGWMNLTKIYTGIQQYWLAYLDDNNLREVDYMVCRSFNASRPHEKLKSSEIVSREQWKALPSNGPRPLYCMTPKYIVISATQQPMHSCKTRAACIDILRTLQVLYFDGTGNTKYFSDIPFNFLIDGNGNIYEGRGWKHQCEAVSENNFHSLCIAYIGWFNYKLPKERFLDSLKKLIEYSVDKGHVDKNYTLYIQQDLSSSMVKRNLVIVMKNWYRYRGFIPQDCVNYSFVTICLNAVAVLFLCLLFHIFYSMSSLKGFCDKCSFLKSDDISIEQIFPSESLLDTFKSSETRQTNYKNHCIIHQKSSFISSTNQSQIVKLIKIWFFNQFLETVNSRHNQNSFNNYLSSFPHLKEKLFIYKIDLKRKSSNCEDIILSVGDMASLDLFKRLVMTKRCICCYFRSDHIDLTMIANHIRIIK